jgi:hypothetical protein
VKSLRESVVLVHCQWQYSATRRPSQQAHGEFFFRRAPMP